MDDLLSELNGIDGNGGSSHKKQDGSSSPLRPNPKYCSMVQPVAALSATRRYLGAHVSHVMPKPAARPAPHSSANLTPVNEVKGQSWQNRSGQSGSASSSRIPEKKVTIVDSSTMDGMEVDEDVPSTSKGSSSPLRPNEKYCSIVTPSNHRRTARTSAQSERRESGSIAPPHPSSRTPNTHHGARDSPPHAARHSTHHSVSYSHHRPASSQEMDHEPIPEQVRDASHNSLPNHHNRGYWESQLSERYSGQHEKSAKQIPNVLYSDREIEQLKQRGIQEQKKLMENEKDRLELERRKRVEAEKMEKLRAAKNMEIAQKQAEQQYQRIERERRRKEEEQLRKDRERRRKEEEQLVKDRERQRKDQERLRQEARDRIKSKYDTDSNKQSRSTRKSFGSRSEQKEDTVSTPLQELEVLKARYKEDEEKREEAKRAEALERLVGCLDKIDERRKDEPEPMEVEESDTIESMVPARSAMLTIAPIPLIIKAEPIEDNLPRQPMRVDEIPLPPGTPPARKEDAAKAKDESEEKKDEEDLVIIEKPPVEMVTLSDDEGTVVTTEKAIKQEEGVVCSSASAVVDDDLWIVGSKRGGNWKKKHVFDLSKVKKEKEDVPSKDLPSSEKSATTPFDVTKVKSEPTDKATPAKEKTIPQSSAVKKEPADEVVSHGGKEDTEVKKEPGDPIMRNMIPDAGGSTSRGDANTAPQSSTAVEESAQDREAFGPALPPAWPLADEEERGTVQAQPAQDPIEEAPREENVDQVSAALAAARRLILQIGESKQQERRIRQRPAHQPVPGSFLHTLRTESRKRGQECDPDEHEDEWLQQIKNHPSPPGMCMWGARKRRKVEEDGKGTGKMTKD